jgi:hypothetical protein
VDIDDRSFRHQKIMQLLTNVKRQKVFGTSWAIEVLGKSLQGSC